MAERFFPLNARFRIGVVGANGEVIPSPEFIREYGILWKRVGEYEALTNLELEELSDTRNETLQFLAIGPKQRRRSDVESDSFAWSVREVTSSGSVYVGEFIEADATSASIALTLPDVAASKGRMIGLSKTDSTANVVSIVGTINGDADVSITEQYTTLLILSNGTEWRLI